MLQNYLRIAFRLLWRKKIFSLVNITGLAIGMTACFLIFLYVRFETSYDRFHTKADRIFRVVRETRTASGIRPFFTSTFPTGPARSHGRFFRVLRF